MTRYEYIITSLKSIEYRHSPYFNAIKKDILDCVVIQGDNPPGIHIIKSDLPKQIKDEINNITNPIS